MMTFKRVLESMGTRLEHMGLAGGARDHVVCVQEQLHLGNLTLTLGYLSAVRPRRTLSFLTKVLKVLDVCLMYILGLVPAVCHPCSTQSTEKKHVLLSGPICNDWRTGLAVL